jgi:hypothetical protein
VGRAKLKPKLDVAPRCWPPSIWYMVVEGRQTTDKAQVGSHPPGGQVGSHPPVMAAWRGCRLSGDPHS